MHRLFFLTLMCLNSLVWAQTVTIKGRVFDGGGKPLSQAHVLVVGTNKTTITSGDGIFTLQQAVGKVELKVSFTGYRTQLENFKVSQDTTLLVILESKTEQLREVVIEGSRQLQSDQFETTRSSTLTLSEREINSIPVIGGEADPIKTIQLLPGVSKGVEGTTDLFVRGGAADQNLVLLDGAPVYNTGHLFGFLSVFNPDMLQGVESINGAFPAQYGGRLSSILNVNTKSNFTERTQVSGNIGLLASRLMVRQPIVKNKLEVWVAGRRTYIDQVVRAIGESLPYYFYDVNTKVIYRPSSRDQLEVTHYAGDDVMNFSRASRDTANNFRFTSNFTIGNSSQTVKWKRTISPRASSSLHLYRTQFKYTLENTFEDSRLFTNSNILDYGAKWQWQQKQSESLTWLVGIESVKHRVAPNIISTSGEISQLLESSTTQLQTSIENNIFFQADGQWRKRWNWSTGFRVSSAWVSGRWYANPEPRLAVRYQVAPHTAIKASYSRMAQYLHRISSAAVAFPTDIWYPVTASVRPQTADQATLAVVRNFPDRNVYLSVEGYYKDMQQLIGYREGTNLFLNTDFEQQLIQGKGKSYGLEILIKKESGNLTGWIAYTWSKSLRQYDLVNQGQWFLARYDRRHNGSLVANYEINKRWSLSGVFEFISGSRFTPVIGQYIVPTTTLAGVQLIPVYAPINSVKLVDTHRLDLGIKFRSKEDRLIRTEWFAGVYNVYNRATPIGISIEPNGDGSYRYEQPGLFGLLPFISYGFKF